MKDKGPFLAEQNLVYSLQSEGGEQINRTTMSISVNRREHGNREQYEACKIESREIAVGVAAMLNARDEIIAVLQTVQAQQPTLESDRVSALLTKLGAS